MLLSSMCDALPAMSEDEMELVFGTEDLPDAFRGYPVHPDDYGASVVALLDPQLCVYMLFFIRLLAYGLAIAVVSFNRLPTLLVAVNRR